MVFSGKQGHVSWKLFSSFLLLIFLLTVICSDLLKIKKSNAQSLGLPEPTAMLELSSAYQLPVLKGLRLDRDNPLDIEFLIDSGNVLGSKLSQNKEIQESTQQLIRYFLAALTVPEKDLWVNLSPYESDRVVENNLGQTDLGTDLLKQDYILKQLSSSLTSPETTSGKEYWRIKNSQYKSRDLLNKIWIKPEIAEIYEKGNLVFITSSKLKVESEGQTSELLIDEVSREVNEGKHFANLRQIYNALILAIWFKQKTADSFYKNYVNQQKIAGIDIDDKTIKDQVYKLYCESFQKGVYEQIKVEKETKLKRKFFCGGFDARSASAIFVPNADIGANVDDYLTGSLISAASALSVKQHEDLNYVIADLIGTQADLSKKYKKKEIVTEVKKLLELVKKEKVVESAKVIADVEKILNDESFELFFLRPKYGYNTFSSLTEDENSKPVIFNFQNHVGHNSSKAKLKENNVYIATPSYDSKTESEKYAMVLASLVNLANKDTNIEYEQEFIKVYDDKFNTAKVTKLSEEITDYIKLKDSLWEAVVSDDNRAARKIYKKWVKVVEGLEKPIREVSQISLFNKMSNDADLAQNAAGYIKEIYDTSETVRPKEVEAVKQRVINRVVDAFIAEDDREFWNNKLDNDINPQSAHALIDDDFFDDANFSDKKDFILHSLEAISRLIGAEAAYMPDMKKVVVRSVDNLLLFESNLVHELIHYLADHDIIKIDAKREYPTFAGEAVYIIKRLMDEGLSVEDAEKVVAPMLNGVLGNEELGQALSAKGKELWKEKGNKIFSVNIAAASENRDYVSIDDLVEEAIVVYESLGLDTRELGLYLGYSRKAPANMYEEEEFESVRYGVERSVSVLLRGALLQSAIESDSDPLVLLKGYLDRLGNKLALDSKEDEKWVNQLKQKIQRFAGAIFGTFVELRFSKNTDSMGFFKYSDGENGLSAVLECWKNTFIPGKNPNFSKNELRKKTEEAVKGHLLLAKYRAEESPDAGFMSANQEDFNDPVLKELWEFMTIPNAVYKGHKGLRRTQSKLSDKKKKEYETVPQNIKMVFESLFDFGDNEINEQVYESYPLHLQYLNTLMYIYSNFQGKQDEKFDDPRLQKDSDVEKAIIESFKDGWQYLLFRTSTMSDEDILTVVKEEIYPKYKELYDKAQKIKEEKKKKEADKLAQQMQQNPQMMQQMQQMAQQLAQQMQQQQNAQQQPGGQQQQPGGQSKPGSQAQQNSAPKPSSQSQGAQSSNAQPPLGNSSQQGVSPQAKPNPQSNAMNQMIQQMAQDIINQQNGKPSKAKPGESKPGKGAKSTEGKPGESKPGDTKAGKDGKSTEGKPGETKSGDVKTGKTGKSSQAKPGESKPGDAKDGKDGKSIDAKPGESKPGDAKAGKESKSSDAKPGEAKSGDAKDAKDGKSTEAKPDESKPGDAKEGKSSETNPGEAKSGDKKSAKDGKSKSALSQLAPPDNLDTLNNVLNGKLEPAQGAFKRKKKKAKKYNWELDPHGALDAERQLQMTGLNEAEQKIYNGWRSKLPKSLIDKAYRMLSAFLIKYLGMKRRASDDLSHEWDDVVDISMSNGGTVDIRKKRPFKVRQTFLLDRSGSMSFDNRLLWIRLIKMLFLEVFVKLNKQHEELFGWQTITYDDEIKRIMTFAKSLKIKEHQKERVIYDALNELDPRGGTDDKKAFLQGMVAHLKEALSRDDNIINMMIAVTDGNFGRNPELEQLLKLADQKGLKIFVVAVGDEECKQDVVDTFGEERAVIADNLSELPYKLMDKFIEVLEDKTGQSIKDSQLISSAIQSEEIDITKTTMNGHIQRIFKDPLEKDFYFLKGSLKERNIYVDEKVQGQFKSSPQRKIKVERVEQLDEESVGSLFENNYFIDRDFLEAMLDENTNDYVELEELSTTNNKQIFEEVDGIDNRYVFADDIKESDLKGLNKSKILLELYKRYSQAKTAKERYQNYADKVVDKLSEKRPELADFDIVVLSNVDGNNYTRIDENKKQIFIALEYFEMMDAVELGNNSLFEYQLRNDDSWVNNLKALNMSAEDILIELIENNLDNKKELSELEKIYQKRARRAGYRHFYYQRIKDRDYLIYRNGTDEWRWERGVGMVNVPDNVTIDDDGNEALILEILQSMYAQGMEYTSYSRDGKFYVRSREGNGFELNMRGKDGIWPNDPLKVFNDGDAGDTVVVANDNELLLEINEQEYSVNLENPLAEDAQAQYMEDLAMWAVFSADQKRLVMLELDDSGQLRVAYDMQVEDEEDLKANRVLVLEGEPGLGKDEQLQATAHLMGEEVWYLTGHEDATEGDIVYRRVLTENGSEYVYSSLNYVQQNGGIVVLSEAQYIDEEAFGALKEAIASGKHDRLIKKLSDDLVAKSHEKQDRLIRKTVNNHIRARLVATTNIKREGIKIEGFNDQAILDRFTNIHFVWKTPAEEAKLQAQLVSNELKRLRPGLTKEEYEKEQQKVLDIAYGLVNVAKDLRLDFMGYNIQEKKSLKADDYSNWQEKLKDPLFHKRAVDGSGKPEMREMGKMPRRAPSPRVIRAILEYAIAFPKSWENSPWDAIEYFYNFEANKMDVKERADQLEYVKSIFAKGAYEVDDKTINFEAKDNQPEIIIRESDFKLTEDGYWEITPQAVDGQDGKKEYWDTIRVKAHPSVTGKLPKEIKKWLKTGNKQNMAILYRVLQMRALGKNIMLIGDQGTGKSVLSRGICKLLSGPDVESYNLSQATTLNKLLQTPELDQDNVVYYQYGPVARAVKESKLVFIDELTQGRPGVQAGLNEALQRGLVKLYDVMLKGAEGFGFIFAANTPGGPFKVEAPSDEFIERCVIFKLPTLPANEMHPFLTDMRGLLNKIRQVNPSIIGRKKKKLNSDGDPELDSENNFIYETITVDGREEDRYEGLVGIYQYLRHKISENPDSDLLRRVPAFRTFEILIPHIIDYWRSPRRLERKDKKFHQKQLWNLFRKYFKQAAKDYEKLYEIEKLLQEAFEQSGLWSEQPGVDAIREYLNGEDMVIEKNPYIRVPKTGDDRIDHALMYLQETNRGSSVRGFINELDSIVNETLVDSDAWLALDKTTKLESIYKAREIYQILNFILERGKGDETLNSTEANYEAIKDIASKIQERLVFDEGLPRELLLIGMQKDDETEFSQAYEQFVGAIDDIALVKHSDQEFVKSFNDKLIKLLVLQNTVDNLNAEDKKYEDAISASQTEILELIDEEIKPVFEKLNQAKNLHNIVNDSKLSNSVLKTVAAANDAYSTSDHIKELHKNLKSHDGNSIFTLAEQAEALAINPHELEDALGIVSSAVEIHEEFSEFYPALKANVFEINKIFKLSMKDLNASVLKSLKDSEKQISNLLGSGSVSTAFSNAFYEFANDPFDSISSELGALSDSIKDNRLSEKDYRNRLKTIEESLNKLKKQLELIEAIGKRTYEELKEDGYIQEYTFGDGFMAERFNIDKLLTNQTFIVVKDDLGEIDRINTNNVVTKPSLLPTEEKQSFAELENKIEKLVKLYRYYVAKTIQESDEALVAEYQAKAEALKEQFTELVNVTQLEEIELPQFFNITKKVVQTTVDQDSASKDTDTVDTDETVQFGDRRMDNDELDKLLSFYSNFSHRDGMNADYQLRLSESLNKLVLSDRETHVRILNKISGLNDKLLLWLRYDGFGTSTQRAASIQKFVYQTIDKLQVVYNWGEQSRDALKEYVDNVLEQDSEVELFDRHLELLTQFFLSDYNELAQDEWFLNYLKESLNCNIYPDVAADYNGRVRRVAKELLQRIEVSQDLAQGERDITEELKSMSVYELELQSDFGDDLSEARADVEKLIKQLEVQFKANDEIVINNEAHDALNKLGLDIDAGAIKVDKLIQKLSLPQFFNLSFNQLDTNDEYEEIVEYPNSEKEYEALRLYAKGLGLEDKDKDISAVDILFGSGLYIGELDEVDDDVKKEVLSLLINIDPNLLEAKLNSNWFKTEMENVGKLAAHEDVEIRELVLAVVDKYYKTYDDRGYGIWKQHFHNASINIDKSKDYALEAFRHLQGLDLDYEFGTQRMDDGEIESLFDYYKNFVNSNVVMGDNNQERLEQLLEKLSMSDFSTYYRFFKQVFSRKDRILLWLRYDRYGRHLNQAETIHKLVYKIIDGLHKTHNLWGDHSSDELQRYFENELSDAKHKHFDEHRELLNKFFLADYSKLAENDWLMEHLKEATNCDIYSDALSEHNDEISRIATELLKRIEATQETEDDKSEVTDELSSFDGYVLELKGDFGDDLDRWQADVEKLVKQLENGFEATEEIIIQADAQEALKKIGVSFDTKIVSVDVLVEKITEFLEQDENTGSTESTESTDSTDIEEVDYKVFRVNQHSTKVILADNDIPDDLPDGVNVNSGIFRLSENSFLGIKRFFYLTKFEKINGVWEETKFADDKITCIEKLNDKEFLAQGYENGPPHDKHTSLYRYSKNATGNWQSTLVQYDSSSKSLMKLDEERFVSVRDGHHYVWSSYVEDYQTKWSQKKIGRYGYADNKLYNVSDKKFISSIPAGLCVFEEDSDGNWSSEEIVEPGTVYKGILAEGLYQGNIIDNDTGRVIANVNSQKQVILELENSDDFDVEILKTELDKLIQEELEDKIIIFNEKSKEIISDLGIELDDKVTVAQLHIAIQNIINITQETDTQIPEELSEFIGDRLDEQQKINLWSVLEKAKSFQQNGDNFDYTFENVKLRIYKSGFYNDETNVLLRIKYDTHVLNGRNATVDIAVSDKLSDLTLYLPYVKNGWGQLAESVSDKIMGFDVDNSGNLEIIVDDGGFKNIQNAYKEGGTKFEPLDINNQALKFKTVETVSDTTERKYAIKGFVEAGELIEKYLKFESGDLNVADIVETLNTRILSDDWRNQTAFVISLLNEKFIHNSSKTNFDSFEIILSNIDFKQVHEMELIIELMRTYSESGQKYLSSTEGKTVGIEEYNAFLYSNIFQEDDKDSFADDENMRGYLLDTAIPQKFCAALAIMSVDRFERIFVNDEEALATLFNSLTIFQEQQYRDLGLKLIYQKLERIASQSDDKRKEIFWKLFKEFDPANYKNKNFRDMRWDIESESPNLYAVKALALSLLSDKDLIAITRLDRKSYASDGSVNEVNYDSIGEIIEFIQYDNEILISEVIIKRLYKISPDDQNDIIKALTGVSKSDFVKNKGKIINKTIDLNSSDADAMLKMILALSLVANENELKNQIVEVLINYFAGSNNELTLKVIKLIKQLYRSDDQNAIKLSNYIINGNFRSKKKLAVSKVVKELKAMVKNTDNTSEKRKALLLLNLMSEQELAELYNEDKSLLDEIMNMNLERIYGTFNSTTDDILVQLRKAFLQRIVKRKIVTNINIVVEHEQEVPSEPTDVETVVQEQIIITESKTLPKHIQDALFKILTIQKEEYTKDAIETLSNAGFDPNLIGTPGWLAKLHNSVESENYVQEYSAKSDSEDDSKDIDMKQEVEELVNTDDLNLLKTKLQNASPEYIRDFVLIAAATYRGEEAMIEMYRKIAQNGIVVEGAKVDKALKMLTDDGALTYTRLLKIDSDLYKPVLDYHSVNNGLLHEEWYDHVVVLNLLILRENYKKVVNVKQYRDNFIYDPYEKIFYELLTQRSSSSVEVVDPFGGIDFEEIEVTTASSGLPVELDGVDWGNFSGFSFTVNNIVEITEPNEYLHR